MTVAHAHAEIIHAYVEAFNRGDLAGLEAVFAPDARIQGVLGDVPLEQALPVWKQLIEGFAIQLTIEDLAFNGDRVAARYTERGTFRAPFFGQLPTHKSYEIPAMEWFEIRDGRIARRWGARDSAAQARQLGMPARE